MLKRIPVSARHHAPRLVVRLTFPTGWSRRNINFTDVKQRELVVAAAYLGGISRADSATRQGWENLGSRHRLGTIASVAHFVASKGVVERGASGSTHVIRHHATAEGVLVHDFDRGRVRIASFPAAWGSWRWSSGGSRRRIVQVDIESATATLLRPTALDVTVSRRSSRRCRHCVSAKAFLPVL